MTLHRQGNARGERNKYTKDCSQSRKKEVTSGNVGQIGLQTHEGGDTGRLLDNQKD